MNLRRMCVVAAFATLAAQAAAAPAAPQVGVATVNALENVPDAPFRDAGNADEAVAVALARAAKSRKRVLIDIGADWCADCKILSAIMALPDVDAFLKAHYEIALVDVGHMNRNLQVPARYGVTLKRDGVPAILIVSPDGILLNRGHEEALVEARNMTPQAVADWLASWAA